MSILAEVISNVQTVHLEKIREILPQAKTKADQLKSEVMDYMHTVYVFGSEKGQNQFMETSQDLGLEINNLKESIALINKNEIEPQSQQILQYASEIEECNIKTMLVSSLVMIHEGLLKIKQFQEEKLYVQAIEEVQLIKKEIPENDMTDIMIELQQCIDQEECNLKLKFKDICLENVIIQDSKSKEDLKMFTVKIKHKNDIFTQVLMALLTHSNDKKDINFLNSFAKTLNDIFQTIINTRCDVTVSSGDSYNTINITSTNASKSDIYKETFENINKVASFFTKNLVGDSETQQATLAYIRDITGDLLTESVVKNVLSDTIPNDNEGLKKYSETINHVKDFQDVLVASNFIKSDDNKMFEYVSNVDNHFIIKKCKNYMKKAHELMKQDLDNIVEVGIPRNTDNPLTELMSDEFPQSYVSKSTLQFIELLDEIMQSAGGCSDANGKKLRGTVETILESYGHVVQTKHERLLQTIPQQVAIFYNNCMYIVHCMNKYNMLSINNKIVTIAKDTFNGYVDSAIAQIEETLKVLYLHNIKSLEKVDANTDKSIRQCLRQNELLKTVWQKVLPYDVYNKTIGLILNALCKYIINVVVSVEDIFAKAAEQLVEVLKLVQTRGAKLFTDPNEIYIFVEQWGRFKELMLILSSGLMEINERWAEGKGPLALHFQPEEVKTLIRALFQNNEKRDFVLAKIHL